MSHNEHHLFQSNVHGYSSNPSNPSSEWDIPLPNVVSNNIERFIFSPDSFHISLSDLNQFNMPSDNYPLVAQGSNPMTDEAHKGRFYTVSKDSSLDAN
jgi:hypothetical protein